MRDVHITRHMYYVMFNLDDNDNSLRHSKQEDVL